MPKLKLVAGTTVKRKRAALPSTVQCPQCTGIEFIETRVGVIATDGKRIGGQRLLICAECQRKGKRVVV